MNLLCASANRLSACGRALRPSLWRTLRPAAVLDPSGQASPAEGQPCRTAAARFTAARARDRARRRASSAAGAQIGNTGTFPGKPRGNGRACGRHYLRCAICAAPSKGPRGPAAGSGSHDAANRGGPVNHAPAGWLLALATQTIDAANAAVARIVVLGVHQSTLKGRGLAPQMGARIEAADCEQKPLSDSRHRPHKSVNNQTRTAFPELRTSAKSN